MRIAILVCLGLLLANQCAQPELTSGIEDTTPKILLPQQRFYRSGELLANYTMTPDSLLHGLYEEYYLDSTVHRRIPYEHGRINGIYESFYPSGVIASRHHYVNHYPHGPYYWYHENGQLAQRGEKTWGKAKGKLEIYYPNGEIQARRTYRDDRPIGPELTYYPDGSLQLFSYYDQDSDRSFSISYEEDGKVQQVLGNPFADLTADINRLSGKFTLAFNLAVPPDSQPKIRLLRRQGNKAWLCPIQVDSLHYQFREPLPDDFVGKYQLQLVLPLYPDSLQFVEEIFVQDNGVSFGAPG